MFYSVACSFVCLSMHRESRLRVQVQVLVPGSSTCVACTRSHKQTQRSAAQGPNHTPDSRHCSSALFDDNTDRARHLKSIPEHSSSSFEASSTSFNPTNSRDCCYKSISRICLYRAWNRNRWQFRSHWHLDWHSTFDTHHLSDLLQ